MPAGKPAAAHVARDCAPIRERIEEAIDYALLAPEHEQRAVDLPARIVPVVLEIDRSRSSVILAARVDRRRIGEAALVLGVGARIEMLQRRAITAQLLAQVIRGIAA